MINILAVSDETVPSHHRDEIKKQYPPLHALLGCGDLPYWYLDFLTCALETPLFYVLGNHDGDSQFTHDRGEVSEVRGGINLHRSCVNHKGILIAGLEGSVRYRPNGSIMHTQREMLWAVYNFWPRLLWNKIRFGRFLDILITHAPPFGIHDLDDLPHHGFKAFLPFMRWFRPKYLLHGHIHRYRRDNPYRTRYHQTEVINIYPHYLLQF